MNIRFLILMTLIKGSVMAQTGPITHTQEDLFCQELTKVLESSNSNFESIKEGLVKEKIISWGEQEFYKTKVKLDDSELNIISTDAIPVFKASFGTDISITKPMQEKYNAIKLKIKNCLGPGWKFQQENNNDILFSSSYVAKKDDHSPEVRLMLYDNGTGMIAMELRVAAVKK